MKDGNAPGINSKQSRHIVSAGLLNEGLFTKAYLATASPRAAIKAKCVDCCNFDRKEVKACTVTTCPLWLYRPFQDKPLKDPSKPKGVFGKKTQSKETV